MPTKTYTGSFVLAFYLHGSKISGRIVTVDFSPAIGISYKSDTSFEYGLASCIKLASFKSWAMPDSKGVIIGFGTTGGSFQLLKYTFSSPAKLPVLANAFSAPLSMFSKEASATASTPVTWLDFKLLENDTCLLMLGQGSIIYSGTTNPYKPSFSLVQLKPDFTCPSLLYSHQAGCNNNGAFTSASLIKVDLKYHLAFAYWQGSSTLLMKTCHLSIDLANSKPDELRHETFLLEQGDIPLDFHSNESEFHLLSYASIKKFSVPESVFPPKFVSNSKPTTPANFFINHCTLAGCYELVLADMPFLSHFLTARPPRDLVLPPKDQDAAYKLVNFVDSHAASPELRNIILCYCLSYKNGDFASVFAFNYATPNDFKLASGYLMIDRGLIDQGVTSIFQANLDRTAIHFPCELIDGLLQSDQSKQGIRLYNHLVLRCPALVSIDPRGIIKHLDSFGIQRVHQFLRSYQDGPITREEAYKAFFTKVLVDNFQSLSFHFSAHVLTPEEEKSLRALLKPNGGSRAVLGNGLFFLVNYLVTRHHYDKGFAFFFETEETIQEYCSPCQWTDLSKSLNTVAERLISQFTVCECESALLDRKAQWAANRKLSSNTYTLPIASAPGTPKQSSNSMQSEILPEVLAEASKSPQKALGDFSTQQESVTHTQEAEVVPEVLAEASKNSQEGSCSAGSQKQDVTHIQEAKGSNLRSPILPQCAADNGQPISQIWPPLGKAFPVPELEQASPGRFPRFVSFETKRSFEATLGEVLGSSSDMETNEFIGYYTRSKAKKTKK
ncbi:hypothetical protein DSO57_1018495 [Entomophthora muscae]|nr:hypothetical protein DSO57_1018495 [Entomophthora muscae]